MLVPSATPASIPCIRNDASIPAATLGTPHCRVFVLVPLGWWEDLPGSNNSKTVLFRRSTAVARTCWKEGCWDPSQRALPSEANPHSAALLDTASCCISNVEVKNRTKPAAARWMCLGCIEDDSMIYFIGIHSRTSYTDKYTYTYEHVQTHAWTNTPMLMRAKAHTQAHA